MSNANPNTSIFYSLLSALACALCLAHLKNMSAPYQHLGIDFIPLGGLNATNMNDYLASPLISAIGGSWIAKRDLIAAHDWQTIESNARTARENADQIRA